MTSTHQKVSAFLPNPTQEREWNCHDPAARERWATWLSESLRVVEGKWKISIISQLFAAKVPLRLSELHRRIGGVSQKVLIQQLQQLERDAVIVRRAFPQTPPRVEYSLTPIGLALGPSMESLIQWAELRRAVTSCG
jgi:DNA-binding HxlR family transcriptional regulator